MDDGGHGHAEDSGAVVGDPGALGDIAEVVQARQVVERGQVAFVEEGQGGVKGAAGDEVAGGAAFELGVERAVVFGGRGGRKDDLDVRVVLVEGGDDDVLPDGQIVVAPAFDGQGDLFARRGFGRGGFGGLGLGRGLGGLRRFGLCRSFGGLTAAAGDQQNG